MKYYTGALWKDLNSDNPIAREQAETEWKKRATLYKKRYQDTRTGDGSLS